MQLQSCTYVNVVDVRSSRISRADAGAVAAVVISLHAQTEMTVTGYWLHLLYRYLTIPGAVSCINRKLSIAELSTGWLTTGR
jgi:hypothetical protein